MGVTLSPNTDVHPWQELKVSFSGTIADGHCAGDSFSFALPDGLYTRDGATYSLDDPAGNPVATMVVSKRTVTVTLTSFVENHVNVSLTGWLNGYVGDEVTSGTKQIQWDINGETSSTPIVVGTCEPNCQQMPTGFYKWGSVNEPGSSLSATLAFPTAKHDDQVFAFRDVLTSGGQAFQCPVTPYAYGFASVNDWGTPVNTSTDAVTVDITTCSETEVAGTLTIHSAGSAARMSLPITITDPTLGTWTDQATASTDGGSWTTQYEFSVNDGGGSGRGQLPATTPPTMPPKTTPPTTTPPTTTAPPSTSTTSPSATPPVATTPATVPSTTGAPPAGQVAQPPVSGLADTGGPQLAVGLVGAATVLLGATLLVLRARRRER